jgi:hypothetical protein
VKRQVATAALAAALLLPVQAASAVEAGFDGPPAGTRSCGPMQYGFIVWVTNPKTGEPKDVFEYCEPIGPPPTPAS